MTVDVHPAKCAQCLRQLVIGIDENGHGWAYCPKCSSAKPLVDLLFLELEGEIVPPDASPN